MNFEQIYQNINAYVENELYNISTNVIPLVNELNNLLVDKNVEVHMEGTKNLLSLPEMKQENTLKNFLNIIETQDALKELVKNGQIATCYVDADGNPTYEKYANPNGSNYAVEGITSKDGRILGKMGHSERIGDNLYKNITGEFDMKIFEAGVSYFK